MAKSIIKPGDKIDIRLIEEIGEKGKDSDEVRVYRSQVYDVLKDGLLEISMPTRGGKIILLPLGVRFDFVFYSKGSMYRAEGTVKERYKKDNLFILVVEMKSQLEKCQRREYFRLECSLDMKYYHIADEDAEKKSAEEIFDFIREEFELFEIEKAGTVMDISGGGMRFVSDEKSDEGSYILIVMKLEGQVINKQFYLVGKVIHSGKTAASSEKYENRILFILKDSKVREEIVRYIFDEERRMRSIH